MPIDLMSLVEGGAPMPGKRPSGSGNLFANKELMANFEKQAAPDKPPEPQVPRKKWTPPPKPETEYQKAASANSAGGRMPWDPPVRKASSWEAKPVIPTSPAPRMGVKANEPGSPVLKDVVKSSEPSGREEDESPKSRLSDNPFMRRDSKEGLVARSPTKKEDAYPVISTMERPSSEKVAEWAAVQKKVEALQMGGEDSDAENESTDAAWSDFEPKQEETTPAAELQPTKAPEPQTAPATETAPTPVPGMVAEETKAGRSTTAATGSGPKGGGSEPTSAAVAEPSRAASLGKEGKKKSSMGSLFSVLTPRSRRNSKDGASK